MLYNLRLCHCYTTYTFTFFYLYFDLDLIHELYILRSCFFSYLKIQCTRVRDNVSDFSVVIIIFK